MLHFTVNRKFKLKNIFIQRIDLTYKVSKSVVGTLQD